MTKIKNTYTVYVFFCLISFMLLTGAVLAQDSTNRESGSMDEKLRKMEQRLDELEKKLQQERETSGSESEEIERLKSRISQAERHSSADKVELSLELEPRLWSIQMQDVRSAYPKLKSQMPQSSMSKEQIQGWLKNVEPSKVDAENDAVRSLRFRLRLDSQVNENLRFAGRLAAYKVWGDSAGINFNKAGMQDITMDGTSASNPHGNTMRLERAYFVYDNKIGQVPWYISVGRRPSTEGPPLQYKKNRSTVGGSPYAHIINWEFDGASLHFGLEEVTGIPGADIKFCYGSAFESQYGTTSAFTAEPAMDDVDLYGVIGTLYEKYYFQQDTEVKLSYNYAYAPDIPDGFTGLTVMPFTVNKDPSSGNYTFSPNSGMYVSRTEPTTSLGEWQAGTVLMQANAMGGNLDLFLSGAWSHTKAENISENPMYEMLGMSLLSSGGDLEEHDGYSVYTGGRYNMENMGTKLGLEYNYGSKYWFNFTGAEDNLIGSKLATRGHVVEPYIIQSIQGENFFLKLGTQQYWFQNSGSGNPLGEPKDVKDVNGMDSIFPVIEKMQQYYLSAVYRF